MVVLSILVWLCGLATEHPALGKKSQSQEMKNNLLINNLKQIFKLLIIKTWKLGVQEFKQSCSCSFSLYVKKKDRYTFTVRLILKIW